MPIDISIMLYTIYCYFLNVFIKIINRLFNIYDINDIHTIFVDNLMTIYKQGNPYIIRKETFDKKIKIGLLTNEIPPVIYGGVATWIVNFIEMFKNDKDIEVVPIFLEHLDIMPEICRKQYPNIRTIKNDNNIKESFKDIDVCINNLWIAEDTIIKLKNIFPNIPLISVCHSLIRMEKITNGGSCYINDNDFNQQEITFQNSDYVVLISKAEKMYYDMFGYNKFNAITRVIYNSYKPKYDNIKLDNNYETDDIGYIGRHVPRKRPELPLMAVNKLNMKNITVHNMGVDYDKYGNDFWKLLENKHKDILNIIPFTSDKSIKEKFFMEVCWICITGIYEPFGYTICEAIDRRKPIIVGLIDGPKEIIEEVIEHVISYDVDIYNYENDIKNFSEALQKAIKLTPEIKKLNADKTRKCLDKLRPQVIKEEWKQLLLEFC